GGVAQTPRVPAEAIAELGLVLAVRDALELEPADERVPHTLAGAVEAARRHEPLPFVRAALAGLDRDDDPERVHEAPHLGVPVELDEIVQIGGGERAQPKPLGLKRPFHARVGNHTRRAVAPPGARRPRTRVGHAAASGRASYETVPGCSPPPTSSPSPPRPTSSAPMPSIAASSDCGASSPPVSPTSTTPTGRCCG